MGNRDYALSLLMYVVSDVERNPLKRAIVGEA